jgi:acetyltransferase-like isoleucine patch superfamily enzyme
MAFSIDYFACDPRTNRQRMLAGDLYIADDPRELGPQPRRDKLEAAKPIFGDNVWLGGRVIVCPVTIGDSVIGASSVVTQDIPANDVALGNPGRVLREI